jgi:hypothetical protein
MNKAVSGGFTALGIGSWYMPGFNGVLSAPTHVSAGEGQIVGAIFLVGAAILWFLPTR